MHVVYIQAQVAHILSGMVQHISKRLVGVGNAAPPLGRKLFLNQLYRNDEYVMVQRYTQGQRTGDMEGERRETRKGGNIPAGRATLIGI